SARLLSPEEWKLERVGGIGRDDANDCKPARACDEVRRNRAAHRNAEPYHSSAVEQGVSPDPDAVVFQLRGFSGGDGFDRERKAGFQQPDVSSSNARGASSRRGDYHPFDQGERRVSSAAVFEPAGTGCVCILRRSRRKVL